MNELINFVVNLFVQPFSLLMAPFQAAEDRWENSRDRAMLLGLPAVIVTTVAIVMLGLTQIGRSERLESWYAGMLDSAQEDKATQTAMLTAKKNLAVNRGTGQEDPAVEIELIERQVKYLKEQEQIYLSKLMDLDPENLDYAFQLAMAYREDQPEKHLALLNKLAPQSEPVYYRAHEYKAQTLYQQYSESTNYAEKKLLLDLARGQAEHCLVQQANDPVAKSIKARILYDSGQYQEAVLLYKELFDVEPGYFRDLTRINEKLGNDNTVVLKTAIDRFDEIRKKNSNDDTKVWVRCWQQLVQCWMMLEDYEVAVTNLSDELKRQNSNAVRGKFLGDQLARVYAQWSAEEQEGEGGQSVESRRLAFERAKQAYKYNPKHPFTLKILSRFVAKDEDFGAQAKEIYDPYKDPNPPADVLMELGTRSLAINDYERAISLFKRARNKAPKNPLILNNLAYSHLVGQNSEKSATEALTLVEEGLRTLQNVRDPGRYASNLYHTRGTALMQLGRIEDAIASFENALRERDDNVEIIEALISCYEGRIDGQAEMYRDYLKDVRARVSE